MAVTVIVDCFLFNDELDMLELRLRVLGDQVDRFVLVEAAHTFQGAPKPLTYADNRDRFAEWADRIVHVEADLSRIDDPWEREHAQREQIAVGLERMAMRRSDLILLSDVDEIWQWDAAKAPHPLLVFEQDWRLYDMRWRHPRKWHGTVAATADAISRLGPHPFEAMRSSRLHDKPERLADGGWHLTWFGGPQANVDKLHAFSHTELAHLHDDMAAGTFARTGVHVDGVALERTDDLPPWADLCPAAWMVAA